MQHHFACVILFALALAPKENESKKLCFNSNGKFKIAQFADRKCHHHACMYILLLHLFIVSVDCSIAGKMFMPTKCNPDTICLCLVHFGEGENTTWGPQQDAVSL